MTLMLAIVTHAVALSMDFSQSFASLQHRPTLWPEGGVLLDMTREQVGGCPT